MRKAYLTGLVLFLGIFLFWASCGTKGNHDVMISNSRFNQPVYFGFFKNGDLLYYQEESGTLTFYIYNTEYGKKEIGTIENFFLDTGSSVLLDNRLYFYITVSEGDDSYKNILYDFDLENQKIMKHEKKDNSLPGINVFAIGDSVVTLKNERYGDRIETYLDFFNPISNTWKKACSSEFYESRKEGSALYAMYADGNMISIIQDIYDENGDYTCYFVQYNETLDEIRRIRLQGDIERFLKTGKGRVNELMVFDDYIYLRNLSSQAFLGKLTGDEVIKIKEENQLIAAATFYPERDVFFFYRFGNAYLVLDKESGTLEEYPLKVKKNHDLLHIYYAGGHFLIIGGKNLCLDIQYFRERDELSELRI
ncbi:hypothetical protein AALB53_05095 [Lachnospiraceae bacterium 47-T17]